jgi:hypothetical protein
VAGPRNTRKNDRHLTGRIRTSLIGPSDEVAWDGVCRGNRPGRRPVRCPSSLQIRRRALTSYRSPRVTALTGDRCGGSRPGRHRLARPRHWRPPDPPLARALLLVSVIWPGDNQHPLLAQLVELTAKAAHTEGWLTYDPHHDWLSSTDRTDLPDT